MLLHSYIVFKKKGDQKWRRLLAQNNFLDMRTPVDLKEKLSASTFSFQAGRVDCGTDEDLGGYPRLFEGELGLRERTGYVDHGQDTWILL